MDNNKHDVSLMSLHVADTLALLIYYAALLGTSSFLLICEIVKNTGTAGSTQENAVITLLSASLCGSTIFYSRKLYKALINKSYDFLEKNVLTPPRVGTIFFFLLRPAFGAVFSIVVFSLWRASVQASTGSTSTAQDYIFIIIPIGFFAGFSAGKLLEQFESRSVNDLVGTKQEK